MKVKHIGEGPHRPALDKDGNPLPFEAYGFKFPGKGAVEVPDGHPAAEKFRNNSHFECKDE